MITIKRIELGNNKIGFYVFNEAMQSLTHLNKRTSKTDKKKYTEKLQDAGRQYKHRGINEDAMYDYEAAMERLEEEYTSDLCEAYLNILRKSLEYQTSREAIIEAIQANEYAFTKEGKQNVHL